MTALALSLALSRSPGTLGMPQEITSAGTSLSQVPSLFRDERFSLGPLNLDIGGGKYDLGSEYLATRNVRSLVLDPYNRSDAHNRAVIALVAREQGADTVTVCNVLNVIDDDDALEDLVKKTVRYLNANGDAFFQVYEGDKSGRGKATTKGYQRNERTADYLPAVERHFRNVRRHGNVIVASGPSMRALSGVEEPGTLGAEPEKPAEKAESWLTYVIGASAVIGVGAGIYYLANEARYRKEALRDARASVAEAERSLASLELRERQLEGILGKIDTRALGVSREAIRKMSDGKAFHTVLAQVEYEQTTYALDKNRQQINEARSELVSARRAVAQIEAK